MILVICRRCTIKCLSNSWVKASSHGQYGQKYEFLYLPTVYHVTDITDPNNKTDLYLHALQCTGRFNIPGLIDTLQLYLTYKSW